MISGVKWGSQRCHGLQDARSAGETTVEIWCRVREGVFQIYDGFEVSVRAGRAGGRNSHGVVRSLEDGEQQGG